MALMICPECGNKISDKATCCPKCGYPVNNKTSNNKIIENNNPKSDGTHYGLKKTITGKGMKPSIIILVLIVVFILYSYFWNKNNPQLTQNPKKNNALDEVVADVINDVAYDHQTMEEYNNDMPLDEIPNDSLDSKDLQLDADGMLDSRIYQKSNDSLNEKVKDNFPHIDTHIFDDYIMNSIEYLEIYKAQHTTYTPEAAKIHEGLTDQVSNLMKGPTTETIGFFGDVWIIGGGVELSDKNVYPVYGYIYEKDDSYFIEKFVEKAYDSEDVISIINDFMSGYGTDCKYINLFTSETDNTYFAFMSPINLYLIPTSVLDQRQLVFDQMENDNTIENMFNDMCGSTNDIK